MFFRHEGEFSSVISISTDDMAISSNTIESINWVKGKFKKRFEVSDLGEIKWLLGLEVKYHKLCTSTNLSNALASMMPTPSPHSLNPAPHCPLISHCQRHDKPPKIPYKELVGSVAWSVLTTQPDILFPSLTLLQFMQNPSRAHWEAGKHVVHYLKGTHNYVLNLTDPDKGIIAYVDADWGSQHHRHSISGHVVSLAGMPIAWGLKKQSIVVLLSMEAKYVAMTNTLKTILWL